MHYQCEVVVARVFSFRKEQCSPPRCTGTPSMNQGNLSQTFKSLQFRLCLWSGCILGMAQHHCAGWSKAPLLGLCRSRHGEFRQLSFVAELQYQNAAFDHEIMNIKNILSEMLISSSWLPVWYSLNLALPSHCWDSPGQQLLALMNSIMLNFIMKCSPWCKRAPVVLVEEKYSFCEDKEILFNALLFNSKPDVRA